MEKGVVNALTIDVEDAVNQAMRNFFKTDMEPTVRVYNNTMRLIDLLHIYDTKATFFILGEVAKTFPGLIKEISNRGHELGIHGYSHTRYYNLSKKDVRQEIIKTKHLIEDLTGVQVVGHRAPEFSINPNTQWVLDILLDAGIKYDSSIYPANTGRYGWPGFNKNIGFVILNNHRKIIEAPLPVINYFGKDIPTCGGGYLRIYPYFVTHHSFKKIMTDRPVIVYLHPYEIDPPPFDDFYMKAYRQAPLKTRIQLKKYWINRTSVTNKIRKLLQDFEFNTLNNVINESLRVDLKAFTIEDVN